MNNLIKRAAELTEKLRLENLGLDFIVATLDKSGNMILTSTPALADSLTRAHILSAAIQGEVGKLQQVMQQAAHAQTVQLVQKSTQEMTKQ